MFLNAREAVIERQSESVPVAKCATDIYIEENVKGLIQTPEAKFIPNPDYQIDQASIDAAEAKKAEFEPSVQRAENHVNKFLKSYHHPCLGGKLVFVDLAGSEYCHDKTAPSSPRPKKTLQEQQKAR